jgi:hypothetical protein
MWSIQAAIEGLAADRFSPEMKMGLLGAPLLIGKGSELRLSDLNLLVLPGFAALGLNASIHLVDTLGALTECIDRRSTPHALFTLNTFPIKAGLFPDDVDAVEPITETDPIVVDQSVVIYQADSEPYPLFWRRSPKSGLMGQPPAFESRFWALLTLKRASRSGRRSANVTAALLRWAAFAAANSDRLVSAEDTDQIGLAASFLSECCRSGRTPADTRLRRAAGALRTADVDEAFAFLKQAVLIRMGLTAALQKALNRPVSDPLTDMERRELIYLARAGAPELKVLAVHRLASDYNCDHPDVRSTLRQMRYDGNVWVRGL